MIVITFPAGLAGCLEPKRRSTFCHYTEVIVRTCSVSHPSPFLYLCYYQGDEILRNLVTPRYYY